MDLSPARWIWLPSERCLPNTFVLFRRVLPLARAPQRATGWILADSRYRLTVNGQRVQWGPAPADPRWPAADPIDLAPLLRAGDNVIGVEVCYFGGGDGTWAMGAPGLILRLEVDGALIVTDASWSCRLDRAHRPGQYRRWFLRALQEEFDARLHPAGWDTPAYVADPEWVPARELRGGGDVPAIFAGGPEYLLGADDATAQVAAGQMDADERPAIGARDIPLMRESDVSAGPLVDAGRVDWLRDPADWFESRMPDCFRITRDDAAVQTEGEGRDGFPPYVDRKSAAAAAGAQYHVPTPGADARTATYLTFELPEQVAGFPRFTIDAPAGTIVELMVRESHDPEHGPLWLDTYIFHWSRFICREGVNHFETFDYECFKWLQLHIRHASGPVTVSGVGARRREFAWPRVPQIRCAEPALQRLFDASVTTLRNCALESNQDGAGRERQQYSGDCGHQQHAIRYAFGEHGHGTRYLRTFSQGITLDGFFLDCWPGYDRLARLMQRQVGATIWGPILDHGVGFVFDCWNHYLESGDAAALAEPYPRLVRFARYLQGLRRGDGLLPVMDTGIPSVWMDHHAYRHQRHKQCAFNLYSAAMLQRPLAALAMLHGDDPEPWRAWGQELEAATVARFWDPARRLFVVNPGEAELRTCDRSLATAILFDQCPDGDTAASLRTLAETPPTMGLSYPANAVWRYWALSKFGRVDVVVDELRRRWAPMNSVRLNNTLQENWTTQMDGGDQFSHCPLAPLIMLYQCVAGIVPTQPGFASCDIRPQLADIGDLELEACTPRGVIRFTARREGAGHALRMEVPADCAATLVMPSGARQPMGCAWAGAWPASAGSGSD